MKREFAEKTIVTTYKISNLYRLNAGLLQRGTGRKDFPFLELFLKSDWRKPSEIESQHVLEIFKEGALEKHGSESFFAYLMCFASKAYCEGNNVTVKKCYEKLLLLVEEGNVDAMVAYGAFLCHDTQGEIRYNAEGIAYLEKAREAGSLSAKANHAE